MWWRNTIPTWERRRSKSWKQLQQKAAKELCYAQSNGVPVEERIYGTREAALRPSFIQFIGCKNVVLRDLTIEDGPQWTIHPVYCENVIVKHVDVKTSGPNTDGLNPDSCTNVWIEKCSFETGDDCIAINRRIILSQPASPKHHDNVTEDFKGQKDTYSVTVSSPISFSLSFNAWSAVCST